MASKRKCVASPPQAHHVDTSKPTAVFKPQGGHRYTLSVALPGSVISNAQTPELQAQLAGQIARALAVFCVDEIVVFDDGQGGFKEKSNHRRWGRVDEHSNGYTGSTDPNYFLAHVLSYLECPPYLRRNLLGMHPDLRLAGSLPSLDMPHHLRKTETCRFREGVALPKSGSGNNSHTPIFTGLKEHVLVSGDIPENSRVTLQFDEAENGTTEKSHTGAKVVAPSVPKEDFGYFWGFQVRSASSLSNVLTESPFDGGYDVTIGTSERGIPLSDITSPYVPSKSSVPQFNHMLIVLGGVAGLEMAYASDNALKELGMSGCSELFDFWMNLVPGQGSRTIRTEEALWLALSGLRQTVLDKGRR